MRKKTSIEDWMDSQKEGVFGVYFAFRRPKISKSEKKNMISFLISKEKRYYVIVINWKPESEQARSLLQSRHNL